MSSSLLNNDGSARAQAAVAPLLMESRDHRLAPHTTVDLPLLPQRQTSSSTTTSRTLPALQQSSVNSVTTTAAPPHEAIPKHMVMIPFASRDTFPGAVHHMLSQIEGDGRYSDVVGWLPHGRAIKVFNQKRFVTEILPNFFKQHKWESFQRQLNMYGFQRITRGIEKGAYYHKYFLRGMPGLTCHIQRYKLKGRGPRKPAPEEEPDFYSMPPVYPTCVPDFTTQRRGGEVIEATHQPRQLQPPQLPQQLQPQVPKVTKALPEDDVSCQKQHKGKMPASSDMAPVPLPRLLVQGAGLLSSSAMALAREEQQQQQQQQQESFCRAQPLDALLEDFVNWNNGSEPFPRSSAPVLEERGQHHLQGSHQQQQTFPAASAEATFNNDDVDSGINALFTSVGLGSIQFQSFEAPSANNGIQEDERDNLVNFVYPFYMV